MKKIKSLICIILVGLSVSSCKDFLTLMPLNDIVLENFWTDMSDVESVLLGSYAALESGDCAKRMLVWGTYLGEVKLVKWQGARPMEIVWRLKTPMPASFFKIARHRAIG